MMKRGVGYDGSWDVYAGDSNRVRWTFTAAGAPLDITGAVVTAQARELDIDPLPALTAVVEMTDPANGVVHLGWDGDAIRLLLAGASKWTGVYDIQLELDGQVETVHRAAIRAQMDVTRP